MSRVIKGHKTLTQSHAWMCVRNSQDRQLCSMIMHIKGIVVYRVPATGTRSPRIAYRQSLWMAGMWHATGLQATGAPPPSPVAQSQNGVDVQAISNLAIGFFAFFRN